MLHFHPLLDHRSLGVVHVVVSRPIQQEKIRQLKDEVGHLPFLHQKRAHRDPREALAVCPSSCGLAGPRADGSPPSTSGGGTQ